MLLTTSLYLSFSLEWLIINAMCICNWSSTKHKEATAWIQVNILALYAWPNIKLTSKPTFGWVLGGNLMKHIMARYVHTIHTHTHTYIYIYIYLESMMTPESSRSSSIQIGSYIIFSAIFIGDHFSTIQLERHIYAPFVTPITSSFKWVGLITWRIIYLFSP